MLNFLEDFCEAVHAERITMLEVGCNGSKHAMNISHLAAHALESEILLRNRRAIKLPVQFLPPTAFSHSVPSLSF